MSLASTTTNANAFLHDNLLVVKSRRSAGKVRRNVTEIQSKRLQSASQKEQKGAQSDKDKEGKESIIDAKRLLDLHRAERTRILEVGTASLDQIGFPVMITPRSAEHIEHVDEKTYAAYQTGLEKMSSKEAMIKYIPSPLSSVSFAPPIGVEKHKEKGKGQQGEESMIMMEWSHIVECFNAQADAALTRIGKCESHLYTLIVTTLRDDEYINRTVSPASF